MPDLLGCIERDSRVVFDAAASSPDAVVSGCPGWTTTRLQNHLLETFEGVITGYTPSSDAQTALTSALDALGHADTDMTELRAVAQECAVHGWDAATALSRPHVIDADLAAEGLLDFFTSAWPMWLDAFDRRAGTGQRLRLQCTDRPDGWTVRLEHRPIVEAALGEADVVVAGAASELFLWVWGRTDPPGVSGDYAVLESIRNPSGRHCSPGF